MISPRVIRAAVFGVLSADATLIALGAPALAARIYDSPPEGVRLPYVAMPVATMQPEIETDDSDGSEHMLQISVFSDTIGTGEAEEIAARIVELLHRQPLTLSTGTLVLGRLQLSTTLRDKGRRTHVALRFTFLIDG